ncbi:MAG: diguanylate cyclase [Microthrixaceae bacterium]
MNSRAITFVLGVLSACLGVAALFTEFPMLGFAAGMAGGAAGVVALTLRLDDPNARIEERALFEAQFDDQANLLTSTQAQLSSAEQRAAVVEAELAAVVSSQETPQADLPPEDDEDSSLLVDAESQLFSEAFFLVALEARVASARRHLRPVAIALFEVVQGDAESQVSIVATDAAASIRETIRDADTACRLDDGTYAIILEDTPENGAVWTVERVRRNIVARYGTHIMWAGVACYPAHAFAPEELLTQSRAALAAAKEWKQDRIEVALSE